MATVRAFRGARYNPARFPDLSRVISQPYDRVRYGLQERYYSQSRYNVVRILQAKSAPGDRPDQRDGPNVYARARATYDRWCAEDILIRESKPALYVYHQTFTLDGQRKTRKAFIAALKLSPFEDGIVLPHERTHAGPKLDRLRLLRSLKVNTGQVFALYPDPRNEVTALLDAAITGQKADMDAVELYEKDVRQQVWAVRDPATIRAVEHALAPKRNLIVADGHHRYETALAYRSERHPPAGAAANYCMAALVSMDDPGLVILPTHREVFGLAEFSVADLVSRARSCFEITPQADLSACIAHLAAQAPAKHAFGLYAQGRFYCLVLHDSRPLRECVPDPLHLGWDALDAAIAHKIVLERLVGLPEHADEQEPFLRYHRDPRLAVDNIDRGHGNLLVLLNPTRMDQVQAYAEQGVRMPQKSTDFYPKMVAGLTMMPVGPGETISSARTR